MSAPIPVSTRFWNKVSKLDSCWLWTSGKDADGYGKIRVNGKYVKAHRVAYELANGPIPSGLCVLHNCDNPSCVNPAHLYAGTMAQNMADKVRRGRQPRGNDYGPKHTKLTETDVRDIRDAYVAGQATYAELAARYNIGRIEIVRIVLGQRWQHIPLPYEPPQVRKPHPTPDLVREIRQAYAEGRGSYHRLAQNYGLSKTQVGLIVSRRTFKDVA